MNRADIGLQRTNALSCLGGPFIEVWEENNQGGRPTMRVLVVGANDKGGHGLYCRTVTGALRDIGVDAVLYGLRPFATPWYTKVRPLWAVDRLLRASANSMRTLAQIAFSKPDLVHFQLITPIVDRWWIPLISRRVPLVITVHNIEPHKPTPGSTPWFVRPIYRASSALIVHSEANRRRFVELYPDLASRVTVIPHGVWTPPARYTKGEARGKLGIPLDRKVILFFGGIRRNKGLDLLLQALSRITERPEGQRVLLLIAGGLPVDESFDRYASLIEELRLEPYVLPHIGFVSDERVPLYFCASDIIALPYTEGFQAHSGVLMQAYGYGLPAIVTQTGSLGETVREDDTGIVVDRTADSLADGIVTLFANAEFRRLASNNMARLAIEKYSWRVVAEKTAEIYKTVPKRRAMKSQYHSGTLTSEKGP